jgi:hypothetical protein
VDRTCTLGSKRGQLRRSTGTASQPPFFGHGQFAAESGTLQDHRLRLCRLHRQAPTGLKVVQPSVQPSRSTGVLSNRRPPSIAPGHPRAPTPADTSPELCKAGVVAARVTAAVDSNASTSSNTRMDTRCALNSANRLAPTVADKLAKPTDQKATDGKRSSPRYAPNSRATPSFHETQ